LVPDFFRLRSFIETNGAVNVAEWPVVYCDADFSRPGEVRIMVDKKHKCCW
jgi:hypothetical protein